MKKSIVIFYILNLFCIEQVLICKESVFDIKEQEAAQKIYDDKVDQLDEYDEALLQEISTIFSSSYKNVIDVAALYFCGLSVDQNKLYEQIFIQISKDIFNVIKLFAKYVPAMLKSTKLTTKEKVKKSCYVVSATVVLWYMCTEILSNKFKNNSSSLHRSLDLGEHNASMDTLDTLKPRKRPSIDS